MSAKPTTPAEMLAKIHELDPDARILWSDYTGKWWMCDAIEDGSDVGVLVGMAEHGETPDDAVRMIFERMKKCRRLVVNAGNEKRREVRWDFLNNTWISWTQDIDGTHLVTGGAQ
jgi:hypothetical protein